MEDGAGALAKSHFWAPELRGHEVLVGECVHNARVDHGLDYLARLLFLEALALPGDTPDHLVHLFYLFYELRSPHRTAAVLLKDEAQDLDVGASKNGEPLI